MSKIHWVAGICVLLLSCTADFDEINTNPNQPESVMPGSLIPNIIRTVVSDQVGDSWSPGNLVVQYTAEIRDPGADRYVWGSFGTWNTMYNILRDVNNVIQAGRDMNQPNIEAVGLIMKSYIYQILTDCYGDIPYSEAQKGKSDQVYFVAYDPQEEVYAGLLSDLRQANSLLAEEAGAIDGDILYDGDVLKWKKFANSLQLRLLMRQSNQIDPSQEIANIINNPNDFPIMESNDDNAVLEYLNASPNLFPIANTREGSWLDRRLSKTFADKLNEINDPRLPIFAQPTNASLEAFNNGEGPLVWAGVRNGETDENLGSNIDDEVSQLGSIYYVQQGSAVPADGLILTYAEVQFILAEAISKGYVEGDAAAAYESGIRASVEYYGSVSGENIVVTDAYLSDPNVQFNDDNALELIGVQKWINFYFNGLEGWFEWRRTGIPELNAAIVNANNDVIPVRFQYPIDQQTLNETNYQMAISNQGSDDINTKVWWDQ